MAVASPRPTSSRPKGPPLNALRAFEAAARLGSFSAASDELCVTPGAVAQHIKSVEAWAGGQLFIRRAQGVALTALGASILPAFTTAFDHLGEAVQLLRTRADPRQIRIAALPSIAQLWLSPRLPAIRSASPGITVSITAMEWPPNLRREPFDLSVFFEEPPGDPAAVDLCRDVIFPVCAPAVAARLKQPSDLSDATCLHDAAWSGDWGRWLGAADPGHAIDTRGPVYSLYSLALEEAKNGAGVLIGHEPLVQGELASGTLVAPFRTRVDTGRRLAIAAAQPAGSRPEIDKVIDALRT